MNCPICSHDTRIVRTDGTERRRQCTQCGNRFNTTEVLTAWQKRTEELVESAKALAEKITEAAQ